MSNNIKETKTTIIGALLFIIGLIMIVMEYFTVDAVIWTHYIFPIGLTTAGIGFMLAPDRLLDFLFGWAKKRTGV
jgi:membrane-bound ClpP family serine protease